jgi:transposase
MLKDPHFFKEVPMNTTKPVAGIDVAKDFSEFCLLVPDNTVVATMTIRHHSSKDIEKAVMLLQKNEKDFGCSPIVIMESTGHYHKILFHALAKREIDVVIANPIQSDSIKNFDPTKTIVLIIRIYKTFIRRSSRASLK